MRSWPNLTNSQKFGIFKSNLFPPQNFWCWRSIGSPKIVFGAKFGQQVWGSPCVVLITYKREYDRLLRRLLHGPATTYHIHLIRPREIFQLTSANFTVTLTRQYHNSNSYLHICLYLCFSMSFRDEKIADIYEPYHFTLNVLGVVLGLLAVVFAFILRGGARPDSDCMPCPWNPGNIKCAASRTTIGTY